MADRPIPDPDLDNRRALFVYEAARLHAQTSNAPIVPERWGDREPAFRRQFVEIVAKQCGPERSTDPVALHDSWCEAYRAMGWVWGEVRDPELKTHPDLVPFDDLDVREQIKDQVFIDLCTIARLAIA